MPDHTWASRMYEGQRTLEQACRRPVSTGGRRWDLSPVSFPRDGADVPMVPEVSRMLRVMLTSVMGEWDRHNIAP